MRFSGLLILNNEHFCEISKSSMMNGKSVSKQFGAYVNAFPLLLLKSRISTANGILNGYRM